MKKFWVIQAALYCLIISIQAQTRDAYKWPFAETSIWNTPIGDQAKYVPANIKPATQWGMTVDEDYLQLNPKAPLTPIYTSTAGWDRNEDRCQISGPILFEAPMPKDWLINSSTWDGATPNAGLAVIMPDGRTIKQTQPFARCELGSSGTSQYVFPDVDIYGAGIEGAHGATGMSAIGGTIRLGELVPGGQINHAVKFNFFGHKNFFYDKTTKGYRWPARSADGYANNVSSGLNYAGTTPECRVGALLSIPASVNLETFGLETEPARILLRALQNYGAYIVDDTAWDVYAIMVEWSPEGRVQTEFQSVWGFPMSDKLDTPWTRDMTKIITSLQVVNNNTAATIGGGGNPIASKASSFGRAGNTSPAVFLISPLAELHIVNGKVLSVSANASDADGSIEKVQFFLNNKLIGEDQTEPFSVDYTTTSTGSYLLTAKAIDNEGAIAMSQGIRIIVDKTAGNYNKPPTVSITSPADLSKINDGYPMNLSAVASDPDGTVSKVQYFEGFNIVGESTYAPFTVSIPFTVAGKHTYLAKAIDNKNSVAFSAPLTLDIPHLNDLPKCKLTSPKEGAIYGADRQALLQAEASDLETAIKKVEFYVDGQLVSTGTTAPYSFRMSVLPAGNHEVHVKAFDMDNASALSDTIHFSVEKPSSIKSDLKIKSEIYPNPFKNGILTVRTPPSSSLDLAVISAEGNVVFTKNKCSEINEIPRSIFSNGGIYIIRLSNGNELEIFQLVVI